MTVAGLMWFVFLLGWFFVYKYLKFASAGIIYSLVYLIVAVTLGLFLFHEKLVLSEIIGVILAILAIILLGKYA